MEFEMNYLLTQASQDEVRKQALLRLGIERANEECWPTPDPRQVEVYNKGEPSTQKPNNQKLLVDWFTPGKSRWTRDCATTFAHDFIARYDAGIFPLLQGKPSISEVEKAFLGYILYLKQGWRRKDQDKEAAKEHKSSLEQRSRSQNRRKQLHCRCVALAKHHELPNHALQLLNYLNTEGMSSEESLGPPGTRRTYKIKTLPWRSKALTQWLQRIDALPLQNANGDVLRRRADHRLRQISDEVSLSRSPVSGLPRNLYDGDWLKSRESRFKRKLGVKAMDYDLHKLDPYST